MQRCRTILLDCRPVSCRGVAHIGLPVVGWVLLCHAEHEGIPVGLGENRRRSNTQKAAIALDQTGVGNAGVRTEAIPVDQQMARWWIELIDRAMHRQKGSIQDVDLIDLTGFDRGYGPTKRSLFNQGTQFLSLWGGKLFRIIEQWMGKVGR